MERRRFRREFKQQAVRMMTEQGLSVSEVARQLGVSDNCLRNWRHAAQQQGEAAFPGQSKLTPADEEIRRLRAEVQRPQPTSPARRTDLPVHCRSLR